MGSWEHPQPNAAQGHQLPPAYLCTLPVLLLGICRAPVSVILLPCGEDALLDEASGPTPLPARLQLSPLVGGGQAARGLVRG